MLLILGNGFFVAVEFSLISLDVPTVQRMVDDGDKGAEPVLKALKSLSTQLSSCQLGITLTALLTGFFLEPSRSEEHTSELQSRGHLVCRLLLEKKKKTKDEQR